MKPKILLVEDNKSIAEIYKRVLEEEGYEVIAIEDGVVAKEAINGANWDLLLLDVMLPKLDGISLLKELMQNSSLNTKPVLIISNVNEPDFIEECKALGVKEYIIKAEVLPSDILNKVALYTNKNGTNTQNNI